MPSERGAMQEGWVTCIFFLQLGRAKLVGKKHKYFLTSRRRRRRGRKNTYARPVYNRGISRTPRSRQIG